MPSNPLDYAVKLPRIMSFQEKVKKGAPTNLGLGSLLFVSQ